jgi:glucokinase
MGHILGVDIGGTNIKSVLITDENTVISKTSIKTPFHASIDTIISTLVDLTDSQIKKANIDSADILGMGLGLPGLVNVNNSYAYNIPFLEWLNTSLSEPLKKAFRFPVFIENDGNLNALGEFRFGIGKGLKNLILLTLGTGVGGGIIQDGKLVRGASGVAAEVGHMVIDANGALCVCGKRGCFESSCSAKALTRYARNLLIEYPDSSLLSDTKGNLFAITGEMIQEGYDKGDLVCRKTVEIFAQQLSIGLVNLINLFNPEAIILSGGVSLLGLRLLEPVRHLVSSQLVHEIQNCQIIQGSLGVDAGVLGACALVSDRLSEQSD